MPRTGRDCEPDQTLHTVVRGHCGSPIFERPEIRRAFLDRSRRVFGATGVVCFGLAVQRNHCHFLARFLHPPGRTFQPLNTALAVWLARERDEQGAVFQGRFYSDACDEETSYLPALAYVVGNPIHHGTVPTVDALLGHEWSAYGELMGARPPKYVDVAAALALVDPDPARARAALRAELERKAHEWRSELGTLDEETEPEPPGRASGLLSASPEMAGVLGRGGRPVPSLPIPEGWTPALLVGPASALVGADAVAVAAGRRGLRESAARSIVAYVGCELAGWTLRAVAPYVGVQPAALVRGRRSGDRLLDRLNCSGERLLALTLTAARPS